MFKKSLTIILMIMLISMFCGCQENAVRDEDTGTDNQAEKIEGMPSDNGIRPLQIDSSEGESDQEDNSTQEESSDSEQSKDATQERGSSHDHGSSSSGSQATPSAHTHNWVAVTVHHDAEYKTVHHDAVQHQEQQLVTAAWDENVLVSNAWDEEIWETHYICDGCGRDFGTTPPSTDHMYNHMINNEASNYYITSVLVNTIHHDAVYNTVHHDAVYQTVWVTDKAAWDEKVLVKAAWDETYYKCSVCGAKK